MNTSEDEVRKAAMERATQTGDAPRDGSVILENVVSQWENAKDKQAFLSELVQHAEEAKKVVHALGLKSTTDWEEWRRTERCTKRHRHPRKKRRMTK